MHIVPGNHEHPPSRPVDPLWLRIIFGPWLGPILLLFAWVLFFIVAIVLDILQERGVVAPQAGIGLGWGLFDIAYLATVLAFVSMVFHAIRAIYRYIVRSKSPPL